MYDKISKYIPAEAVNPCLEILDKSGLYIKVVKKRKTRHGDFKTLPDGTQQITVNAMDNPYRFLITLIHEIAHWKAFTFYGRNIKPHGVQWKRTFKELMLPFLKPSIFPEQVLSPLAAHMKNPKASSSTDFKLVAALRQFDPPSDLTPVVELPKGSIFKMYNGKIFRKGEQKIKRISCTELPSGRIYLFQPQAEVELIK